MDATPNNDLELVITKLIDAPRDKLFRCWTEAELITQWFTPKPWSTRRAETDPRAGGPSVVALADHDGNQDSKRAG